MSEAEGEPASADVLAGGGQQEVIREVNHDTRSRASSDTGQRRRDRVGSVARTLDSCRDPVVVTTSGRIAYSNPPGAALLGAGSGRELEGRAFSDIVPGDLAPDVLRNMERRQAGEPPERIEYPLVRLDGGGRYVEAFVAGSQFDGEPAVHSILRDLSDQEDLERRMIAALENRLRQIGRELHDGLGQVLTSVGLLSQCLEMDLASGNGKAPGRAQRLTHLTEKAQDMVHSLLGGLTPTTTLRGTPILDALADLCDDADRASDARCVFICEGDLQPPPSDEFIHLYRIVERALSNAVQKAMADNIVVSMRKIEHDVLVLEVSDDGVGFDVQSVEVDSFGITSMYYEARMIGAELEIESSPGEGTAVRCTLHGAPSRSGGGLAGLSKGA